jgi:hypothetical protein
MGSDRLTPALASALVRMSLKPHSAIDDRS